MESQPAFLLDVFRRRWLHLSLLLLLLLGLAPNPAPMRLIRDLENAERAADSGEYALALEHIEDALHLEPRMHGLYEPAFELAMRADALPAAHTYWSALLNSQSTSDDLSCLELDLLVAEHAYDAALSHIKQSAQQCPRAPQALEQIANAAQERTAWEQEENALQLLYEINPTPQVAMRMGILLAARDPLSARTPLKAAGALQADGPALVRELFQAMETSIPAELPAFTFAQNGTILASHEQWQLAVEALSHAVALNPEYADAHAYLGLSLDQAGRDGLESLQEAIRLQWSHSLAHLFLGMHWLHLDNLSEAQAEFTLADRFDPGNPTILVQMATTASREGDTEQALALFRQAAESAPEEHAFWLLLAQFSLRQEVRVADIGVPAARRALLEDPNNPQVYDALGYGYYLLNQPAMAERFILQAIALDPSLASAHYHAGMVWSLMEESEKARQAFQQAYALDPEGAIGKAAQGALGVGND